MAHDDVAPEPTDPDDWADDPSDPETPGRSDSPAEGLAELLRQLGLPTGSDANLEQVLSQLTNQLMAQMRQADRPGEADSATVTWTAAKQAARQQIASLGPDPAPDGRRSREIGDAVHLVDLWLDDHTAFPALAAPPVCWSRSDWIERTLPAWRAMIEPVISTIAQGMYAAMTGAMSQDHLEAPELVQLQSALQPILRQAADGMFGARLGQELGRVATEVVTATDLGLPLTDKPQVAILPTNLAAFADGLDLSETDTLLYHAIREAARQRLFAEVAWIGPQLVALVQHYAREIKIDPQAMSQAIEDSAPDQITLETMSQFELQLNAIVFAPGEDPEQVAILERLETLLALVEGWVDEVVAQATSDWMPSAGALAETVRRRRGAKGGAAEVFSALIGLTVQPSRLREAQALWARLRQDRGVTGRDELWRHPDDLPTVADLADPARFAERIGRPPAEDEWDAELRRWLDQPEGPSTDPRDPRDPSD
ncbi:MAG: zinc-dependent metalloprotease [Propionibacteriaceae bacterium]|jgi:putative hydrolase|nr:zinc-dependent metalloprotease [Propionibacteriaceae bacterium]